jgi:hypothetical protein
MEEQVIEENDEGQLTALRHMIAVYGIYTLTPLATLTPNP